MIVACAPQAWAQTGDIWRGEAGWLATAPPRLLQGEHRTGDVIAEVDLARTRTGRIAIEIVLANDRHGTVTIPAETPAVASRITSVMMRGQEHIRTIEGGIRWCTLAPDMPQICIEQPNALHGLFSREPRSEAARLFIYVEYAAEARLSGRSWSGAEPVIREESIPAGPTIRKQLFVQRIDSGGVTIGLRRIREGETIDFPRPASVAYGVRLHDSDGDFEGLAFQFRRAGGRRVIVEAIEPPLEASP